MIAKVIILFAAFAAVHTYVFLVGRTHLITTGISSHQQLKDVHGNYAFGYDVKDNIGATNSRSEVGDGHSNKKGSYTLSDIDRRARKVEYVADKLSLRAVINTNEPGITNSAPAAAIASTYSAPAAISYVTPDGIRHAAVSAALVAAAPVGYRTVLGDEGGPDYGASLGYGSDTDYGHDDDYRYGEEFGYGAGLL